MKVAYVQPLTLASAVLFQDGMAQTKATKASKSVSLPKGSYKPSAKAAKAAKAANGAKATATARPTKTASGGSLTKAPAAAVTSPPTSAALTTKAPSAALTTLPTNVPTEVPSPAPTPSPTNVPTEVPSPAPTTSPTNVPTEVPSPAPIPATSAPIPAPICATEGQECDTTDCCGGLTCNTIVTCVKPTPSPTDVPTETPTPGPPCSPSFDNAGLKTATYAYLRQGCQTNSTCAIIAEHGDIEEWCTSEVTSMHALFYQPEPDNAHLQAKAFNKNLSKWNVGKVTDMQFLFMGAAAFNQNLCAWGKFASFPYGDAGTYLMFEASGCTYQDSPKQEGGINGPFCASNCYGALF